MDARSFIQSEWITNTDVREEPYIGTIALVVSEKVRNPRKGAFEESLVVTFMDGRKLVLSRTRVRSMVSDLGPETDHWIGAEVRVRLVRARGGDQRAIEVVTPTQDFPVSVEPSVAAEDIPFSVSGLSGTSTQE